LGNLKFFIDVCECGGIDIELSEHFLGGFRKWSGKAGTGGSQE
jgi:hypothetical protein